MYFYEKILNLKNMNKKKLLIATVFCLGVCNYCFAGPHEVTLNDIHTDKGHIGNSCFPNVSSDGDDVTIKSDSTIIDMTVVIRDQYGNVMHQSTQIVGPTETTLYVPNTDGDSEKTTIDLYYDRRHLSGTFEE